MFSEERRERFFTFLVVQSCHVYALEQPPKMATLYPNRTCIGSVLPQVEHASYISIYSLIKLDQWSRVYQLSRGLQEFWKRKQQGGVKNKNEKKELIEKIRDARSSIEKRGQTRGTRRPGTRW